MNRLIFQTQPPALAPHPNRADIACFVGFVGRRPSPLPGVMQRWLGEQGWGQPPYGRAGALGTAESPPSLLDVPVPIDSWSTFDYLFAWDQRPVSSDGAMRGGTYLGAAVRSFFAQGGQRCYVVRVGDPWPFNAPREQRLNQIERLVPGYRPQSPSLARSLFSGSPSDRGSWHGVGHLFGLPDVAFLGLPDLADGVAADRPALPTQPPDIGEDPPETFVVCSDPAPTPPQDSGVRLLPAPRCDGLGYGEWVRSLHLVAALLERHQHQGTLRTVQLVAAIPLPLAGTPAEQDLGAGLGLTTDPADGGIASRFVQLVYPWVLTPGSAVLPEQLESPEGLLIGLLARNALSRGTYRSAANSALGDVFSVVPLLSQRQQWTVQGPIGRQDRALIDRVSLLGPTPDGLQLLSDVTTSLDERYRPASVNRLVAGLIRAARQLGEALVFEASGEYLWLRLEESLDGLLQSLFTAGALGGTTAAEAYGVRCDRTTMTQNDLDHGRVIAQIQINPALPVEQITVVLALNDSGQLLALSAPGQQEAA